MKVLVAVVMVCIGQSWAQPIDVAVLDSYLHPYVQSQNFSGSVRIEKNGSVLFDKAYGFADREKKLPNTNTTRFHVASVSMQFTAAAVLRLVDQGRIRLDSHVSDVVPGITGGDKVTIRDLLLERSGLPDINDLPDYDDILQHHQTSASLVAKIKDRPLLFEPGSKFLHEEHSAFNLLALIVERETRLPFAAAMEKLVFRPARLSRSWIDDDATPAAAAAAKGYQPQGVDGLEPASSIHWSAKTGNASVVTTTGDEALWVRVVFGDRLLKKTSREAILGTSQKVGYGWFRSINPRYKQTAYYMNGRAPGFASFVLYLPRERMTVIIFSNIYSSATTTIGNDLAAIALGLPYERFQPSQTALSAEQINMSIGRFQFGPDFYQANAEVTLIPNGSELSLRWPSGDLSPLIPIGRDRFIDRSYWEEVSIERNAAGLPKAIVYDHFRGDTKADLGPLR